MPRPDQLIANRSMLIHSHTSHSLFEQIEAEAEEAEIDRLAAALGKGRELPAELVELMWAIATRSFGRMGDPGWAPFQFGRFEALDTKFGRMSMVLEARDPQSDRKVAIKLAISAGPEAEVAMLAEARARAVMVYGTGKWNDRVYLVMDWVTGNNHYSLN